VSQLDWVGISGAANLLSSIKLAKWYELGPEDVVLTVLTDSMELYGSRLRELNADRGAFTELDAAAAYHHHLLGTTTDHVEELTHPTRKRVHNLKYFTWVEQQGRSYDEIQAQWYDERYWSSIPESVTKLDELIVEFNRRVGLQK
jgi:cysteine synthase A